MASGCWRSAHESGSATHSCAPPSIARRRWLTGRRRTLHLPDRDRSGELDPDRRAWHRAHAATAPDGQIADELMHSTTRAQRRGGIAAAAAFLERAVALTARSCRGARNARWRRRRRSSRRAAADSAQALLAVAEVGPLDEFRPGSGAASSCRDRVRECDAATTRRRCCCGLRSGSRQSTPSSRARPISRRWCRRSTPGRSRRRHRRRRRCRARPAPRRSAPSPCRPGNSCSSGSRPASRTDTRPRLPRSRRRCERIPRRAPAARLVRPRLRHRGDGSVGRRGLVRARLRAGAARPRDGGR